VYLLALHPCDDRYNAVAQGSPRVYAVGMPTDFTSLKALHLSFDPGLDIPLAAMPFPDARFNPPNDHAVRDYAEFCARPGGCWNGGQGLPPFSGFYTLANDFVCTIYSPDVPMADREIEQHGSIPGSHCPFSFSMGWNPVDLEPIIVNDTSQNDPADVSSHYIGLQLNTNRDIYAGLDLNNPEHTPDITKVVAATVTLRDFLCIPHHWQHEPHAVRYIYYFDWNSDHAYQVAVNLKEYTRNGYGPDNFDVPFYQYCAEDDISRCPPNRQDNAMHMSSDHRYLSNPALNAASLPQRLADCEDQSAVHDQTYVIPVRDLIRRLQAEGHVSPAGFAGRYGAGILAGIEQWGHAYTELHARDHALFVDP
jgi:hypothetical protein